MRFHSILLALSAAVPAVFSQEDYRDDLFPKRCLPNPCEGITSTNETYVCGDARLGPVKYPTKFPLRNGLRTYARFGSLCPAEFLEKWATSASPDGTYIYPPSNGFVVDDEEVAVLGNVTLPVGQKLDRFGSEYGAFLAPLGAPYIERSLPPNNLITYDGAYPFNYHVYEVTKEFVVGLGPIAPWFEQPGMGTQFLASMNVLSLIEGGFLRRLEESEFDERVEYSNDYTEGPNE
ncbi:TNT domain-containing protein [Aspergillus undulatus]|uniref:TNT domain-containing protein n=1 Tax=Aspergillus undulatus TaxID=1810928 RepID=UPI003CCCA737